MWPLIFHNKNFSLFQGTGDVGIQSGYNVGKSNRPLRPVNAGIKNWNGRYEDGLITCEFRRPAILNIPLPHRNENKTFQLENDQYSVFLAEGPFQSGVLGYHNIKDYTILQVSWCNFSTFISFSAKTDILMFQFIFILISEIRRGSQSCGQFQNCSQITWCFYDFCLDWISIIGHAGGKIFQTNLDKYPMLQKRYLVCGTQNSDGFNLVTDNGRIFTHILPEWMGMDL